MQAFIHTKSALDADFCPVYRSGMSALRRIREQLRLSQSALADRVGTSQPQIKRLESGERKLTKEWAERLAPALNVTARDLLFPEGPIAPRVVTVPVAGQIQAGNWIEAIAVDKPEMMPIVDTEGYDDRSLYVLRVKGDSMDEFVADGGYVVCVDAYAARVNFQAGMVVHVERRRFDGQMVETTLKEIGKNGNELTLIPRSTNKAHKVLTLGEVAGEEVEIKGLVLGKYEPTKIR